MATGTDSQSLGAGGSPGAAYSSDGGQTWSVASVAATESGGLDPSDCITASDCVAVGYVGATQASDAGVSATVMYVTDGGKSWPSSAV